MNLLWLRSRRQLIRTVTEQRIQIAELHRALDKIEKLAGLLVKTEDNSDG